MGLTMARNSFIFNFKKLPGAFILALSIILFIYFIELFVLPINFFTYRAWEAIIVKRFHSVLPGHFYPNMKISMIEEGDLGRHTKFAVKKPVKWETDRYGYRKRDSNISRYKIVIIGDSNIAGSGLTQEDMLSELLERRLKVKVYPLTSTEVPPINTFLNDERFVYNPPEIVIVASMERNIAKLNEVQMGSKYVQSSGVKQVLKRYLSSRRSLTILLDRIYKNSMCNFFGSRIKAKLKSLVIKSDAENKSAPDPKMLFYQGIEANKDIPREEIERIAHIITSYDRIFKSRGIRFIFLPIPNKESVYYDYLPIKKRPVFLKQLIQRLQAESIEAIDTQRAFEETRRERKILLYHTDDTHWNEHGVELVAGLIEGLLKEL